MPRSPALPLLALALAPALVAAPARAEVASADFSPEYEKQLLGLDDFSYDSDWFPKDAALQLRLIVHAGNTVRVRMPGDGLYDWDPQAIRFAGDAMAGELTFDIGLELNAKIRIDVTGFNWESDLLGPYDYAVISTTLYTPYLLPGNPERPVIVMDQTDGVTVASVDVVPDILIAHGHLDLDVIVEISGALECSAIEARTDDPMADLAVITEELAAAPLAAGPGPLPDPFAVDATLFCDLETTPTIIINPLLIMEVFGKEYEVAGVEVPVDLPPVDEALQLGPLELLFDRPPPAPDPTTTTGGDETTGAGTSDSGSGTGGDVTTGDGDASTGDDAASGTGLGDSATASGGLGGPDEEGCACRAGGGGVDGGTGWLALLALGVRLGGRRRRGG